MVESKKIMIIKGSPQFLIEFYLGEGTKPPPPRYKKAAGLKFSSLQKVLFNEENYIIIAEKR